MDRKKEAVPACLNGERLIVLQQLLLDADDAIESFHRNGVRSKEQSNGVRCTGVRDDALDGAEPSIRVIIEGSDPGDRKPALYVTMQLRRRGWTNFEVELA